LPSYGLIVEGDGDAEVFQKLLPMVNSPDAAVYPLICGGIKQLMKQFPELLRRFEYVHNGEPVDRALVIADCDNKSIHDVLSELQSRLGNRTYKFTQGLRFVVVRRKLDTWLLADEKAINAARQGRGQQIQRVNDVLEDLMHPKERLQRIMSAAKLIYTPATLGRIAENIDVAVLTDRVPSFRSFHIAVRQGLLDP